MAHYLLRAFSLNADIMMAYEKLPFAEFGPTLKLCCRMG